MVVEEGADHLLREATIGGTTLRGITFEPGRKVTFFRASGLREGAIVHPLLDDADSALPLRFPCCPGLRDRAPDGPGGAGRAGAVRQRAGLPGRAAGDAAADPGAAGRRRAVIRALRQRRQAPQLADPRQGRPAPGREQQRQQDGWRQSSPAWRPATPAVPEPGADARRERPAFHQSLPVAIGLARRRGPRSTSPSCRGR
ncbi:hypothetical protein [Teichococcus deserti]|uniref:hypothetical protein n=1 Tax=Teichococcus deserti TaxID=1817963 RepID=UPI001F61BCAE|nr:hypothetical protein [Pseudoroseomonas deserti]